MECSAIPCDLVPDPRFAELVELTEPVAARFEAAGHSIYAVGGMVRDAVLGAGLVGEGVVGDIDLTTDADPGRIKELLAGFAGALWTQGERFGTIGCMVGQRTFEITTHRTDRYESGSRKPMVRFTSAIESDLARRDFTVNAMAVRLPDGELVDPFRGEADLAGGVLRTPLEPEVSFSDDPLRMLRAARFVAALRLAPRPELVAAMAAMGDRLAIVSAERQRAELDRLLLLDDPAPGLELLLATGLAAQVVPELDAEVAAAVARAPARLVARFATLLAGAGEAGAAARLRALRSSNDHVQAVRRVVRAVEPLLGRAGSSSAGVDAAVRRFASAAGPWLDDAVATLGARRPDTAAEAAAAVRRLAAAGELDDLRPQLDGDDVQRVLGVGPGPVVGEALAFLQELRWEEGSLDDAEVRRRLQDWGRRRPPSG
jgi:poly(A) polymerase